MPITHAIDDVSEITQNKQHRTGHRSVVGSIVTLYFRVPGFGLHPSHLPSIYSEVFVELASSCGWMLGYYFPIYHSLPHTHFPLPTHTVTLYLNTT